MSQPKQRTTKTRRRRGRGNSPKKGASVARPAANTSTHAKVTQKMDPHPSSSLFLSAASPQPSQAAAVSSGVDLQSFLLSHTQPQPTLAPAVQGLFGAVVQQQHHQAQAQAQQHQHQAMRDPVPQALPVRAHSMPAVASIRSPVKRVPKPVKKVPASSSASPSATKHKRWAGGSYASSPAPSTLAKPTNLSPLRKAGRGASSPMRSLLGDFEALAPQEPTLDPLPPSMVPDVHQMTRDLRAILNVGSS